MPKLNHGERELSFEMHGTRPVPESRVDWRGCGLASHLSEGSFRKNKTSWTSSHIGKGSRHGVHEMRTQSPCGPFPGSICPKALGVSERGQDAHWDPGSEERMPDFRAFGGGGGGALASLRTGNGGAISAEFLWLLS